MYPYITISFIIASSAIEKTFREKIVGIDKLIRNLNLAQTRLQNKQCLYKSKGHRI